MGLFFQKICLGLFQLMLCVQSSYLFILHDAGESYMSLEPINEMIEQGIEINILLLGEPASTIYADMGVTLEDIGINITILDGTPEARAQLLTPFDTDLVVSYFSSSDITIVCAGMVYAMEAQLSIAFKTQVTPSYIVGLDDSFSLWSNGSLPAELFVMPYAGSTSPVADEVFTAADSISEGVIATGDKQVIATTVGNPSLEDWAQDLENTTQIAITRSIILGKYTNATSDSIKVLTYAGGYGGQAYTDALLLLCSAAQQLKSDGFLFVFSPHPGYSSSYESGLFSDWSCGSNLLVYNESTWDVVLDTSQLVVASNGSFSEASTVGGQSVSVTKPHTYTDASFRDVFTDAGLIPTSPTNTSLVNTLNVTFRSECFFIDKEVMAQAGVPVNGTANIMRRLSEIDSALIH